MMGEENSPNQKPNLTHTQLQPEPKPVPLNDLSTAPTVANSVVVGPVITNTSSSAEIINNALPIKTSSPPAKMHPRPRKVRKISPDHSSAEPNPSQESPVAEATTPPTQQRTPKSSQSQCRGVMTHRIAARSLSVEGEVEIAIRHLGNADPLLGALIEENPRPAFESFRTPFLALTRSILYQQLAYKAGTSIYSRFVSLCGGEAGVVPENVLALTPQQLRQIGVSGRKASYLHDLARKYQNGILSDTAIVNMDDKSLFTMLTMVNGIGSWSVHMFMIFSLHRPDVLPINDLGVRKGVQLLYNLEEMPRPSHMDQLCDKWRPYRSVASWYMWRLAHAKGAPSSATAVAMAAASAALPEPQLEEQQQEHQHIQQMNLVDPVNNIFNIGACAWGQ